MSDRSHADPPESKGGSFDFRKSLKRGSIYSIPRLLRVERYFTRPLAAVIARLAFSTPITPNHLTYVSLLLGIAAAAAFLGGRHAYFALAGILFQLSSIFDCADGMLARSRDACTRHGAFLDLFCDRLVDFLVFTGVVLGWYIHTGSVTMLILGMIVVGLYHLQITLYHLMREYLRIEKTGQFAEARGLMVFILLLGSLLGRLDAMIFMAYAVTLSYILFQFIRIIRSGGRTAQP